jgi:hypothetical protein
MSGRGVTRAGQRQFMQVWIPFLSFMVLGSYGLSEWVGAKMRVKEEKKQQVERRERVLLLPCPRVIMCHAIRRSTYWTSYAPVRRTTQIMLCCLEHQNRGRSSTQMRSTKYALICAAACI